MWCCLACFDVYKCPVAVVCKAKITSVFLMICNSSICCFLWIGFICPFTNWQIREEHDKLYVSATYTLILKQYVDRYTVITKHRHRISPVWKQNNESAYLNMAIIVSVVMCFQFPFNVEWSSCHTMFLTHLKMICTKIAI